MRDADTHELKATWTDRIAAALWGTGFLATFSGEEINGETLWEGARAWAERFRAAGLVQGDRVVLAVDASPTFIEVMVAGFAAGLTICPVPPGGVNLAEVAEARDATAGVVPVGAHGAERTWCWFVHPTDPGRTEAPARVREAVHAPSRLARVLVGQPTGTSVALSDTNLAAVVDPLLAALPTPAETWMGEPEWHSAEGLVTDLLPSLLCARRLVRSAAGVDAFGAAVVKEQPTHVVADLGALRTLLAKPAVLRALAGVEGVGYGPGLDAALASQLRWTRLRAARGTSDLSGLVTLGEPGLWREGTVGRPLPGASEAASPGVVKVQGPSVSLGTFDAEKGLVTDDPNRVVMVRFS